MEKIWRVYERIVKLISKVHSLMFNTSRGAKPYAPTKIIKHESSAFLLGQLLDFEGKNSVIDQKQHA